VIRTALTAAHGDRAPLGTVHPSADQRRHGQETIGTSRDKLRARASEQAALRRMATLVTRGASPTEVFDAVAAEVSGLLASDTTSLLRFEPDGAATVLAIRGAFALDTPVGTRLTLEGEGVMASVLRTGRPARMEDYGSASGSMAASVRELGIRSGVGAPISLEGRLWGGVFAAWARHEPPLVEAEGRMAEFTELIATAIASAESRAELAASRARVVAASAEERRRVVRDLHDGAQQHLVRAVITLKLALQRLGSGDPHAEEFVSEALGHTVHANSELRELAHGMLPSVLTSGGLRAGVNELISRSSLPVTVDVPPQRFPTAIETTAYFVVSEALTNVLKHSGARSAEVGAHVEDGILRVAVRDDGVGEAEPGRGSGLTGLRDRVEALGGTIRITSPPGHGTSLSVEIPVEGR
jgi:signal transduction histidine kinase